MASRHRQCPLSSPATSRAQGGTRERAAPRAFAETTRGSVTVPASVLARDVTGRTHIPVLAYAYVGALSGGRNPKAGEVWEH